MAKVFINYRKRYVVINFSIAVYLTFEAILIANLQTIILINLTLLNIPSIIQLSFLCRAVDASSPLSQVIVKFPRNRFITAGHITFAQFESALHKPFEKLLGLREAARATLMHISIFSFKPSSKQASFARALRLHQIYTFSSNISQASCLATILTYACFSITFPQPKPKGKY